METNKDSVADNPMQAECEHTDSAPDEGSLNEIHIPIGKLLEDKVLKSVVPSDSLEKAITIMLLNDYSQLPVIDEGNKSTTEVISWKSIGFNWAANKQSCLVSDCKYGLPVKQIVHSDTPLLEAVEIIIEMEFVLVNDGEENGAATVGIVTASDLAHEFKLLAEPFLIVREVEIRLRQILNKRFDEQDFRNASPRKQGTKAGDLSFEGYCRLLCPPDNWSKMGLKIDRGEFIAHLRILTKLRNDIMHFKSGGLSKNDLTVLHSALQFFKGLPV